MLHLSKYMLVGDINHQFIKFIFKHPWDNIRTIIRFQIVCCQLSCAFRQIQVTCDCQKQIREPHWIWNSHIIEIDLIHISFYPNKCWRRNYFFFPFFTFVLRLGLFSYSFSLWYLPTINFDWFFRSQLSLYVSIIM